MEAIPYFYKGNVLSLLVFFLEHVGELRIISLIEEEFTKHNTK
jgi:hypothetical protein